METKLGSKFEMPLDDANQNDLSTIKEEQLDGPSKDEDVSMQTMSVSDLNSTISCSFAPSSAISFFVDGEHRHFVSVSV